MKTSISANIIFILFIPLSVMFSLYSENSYFEHKSLLATLGFLSLLAIFLAAKIVGYIALSVTNRYFHDWPSDPSISVKIKEIRSAAITSNIILGVLFISVIYVAPNEANVIRFMETPFVITGIVINFISFFIRYSLAGKMIAAAKNNLPHNTHFSIYETQDQCWIYSKKNNATYRTIVGVNDDGDIISKTSYLTGESTAKWCM
jgi:hypothetical protein